MRGILIAGGCLCAFLVGLAILLLPVSETTSTSIIFSTGEKARRIYKYGEGPMESTINWGILLTNVASIVLMFGVFIVSIILITLLVKWVWTKW